MNTIWNREIREVKNHTLAFVYEWKAAAGDCLKIAAGSLYRIFANGKLMGYGPARGPHGYARIDCYDFSGYAGEKVRLVAEVSAPNVNSYYVVDELPFFAAELLRDGCILAESEDFTAYRITDRVEKVQRFSFQRAFVESYRMKACRSVFLNGDNSLFPVVETQPVDGPKFLERHVHYPRLDFAVARLLEQGTVTVDGNQPPMRDRCMMNINENYKGYPFDSLEECISDEVTGFCFHKAADRMDTLSGNTYRMYDFTRTLTGFFRTRVRVLQTAVFYILFDEVISEENGETTIDPFRNTCCNVLKYRLEPGEYELLAFEANSARFAAVCVTMGEVLLSEFGMVTYENPDVARYVKDTGDAGLNQIIEAAKNTFAQNAVDILTDCPSRERAGWLCDSYFSSRAEAMFTGENLVERSFLENYILSPQSPFLPKGMLPMCYPADHNDGIYIPNWTMWLVLELKNYLERTGDHTLIEQAKKRVYDLVSFFARCQNEDGLLENLESWVFIEWSQCNDPEYIRGVNYPSNMLYAAMLDTVGTLYQDQALVKQAAEIRKTIVAQSFNGTFFEDNRVRENGALVSTGHLTETCQYYAFYFGVATPDTHPELFRLMMSAFGPQRDVQQVYADVYPSNAIVGNYLRLELLLWDQQYAQVLRECKAFFTKMAELTGTLWEHSGLNASLNHGFASVAACYIVECIERINQQINFDVV